MRRRRRRRRRRWKTAIKILVSGFSLPAVSQSLSRESWCDTHARLGNENIPCTHKMANGRGIYQSFCESPDHRLLFIPVYVPVVVQKSAFTNLLRGLYMIKPISRKTTGSNTKNIKLCDRHAQHRSGMYKCKMYLVYKPIAGRKSWQF